MTDRYGDGFAALEGAPFPEFSPGEVWLAGAGPGAVGLLTLLAFHGLRHCDVIVHDALVNEGILELANPRAEIISAGKRGGRADSAKQPQITATLTRLAREGRRVLRLKGGDPYLFGRGAEEALELARAGVRFRVIPGIPAGIGGLAYAGIPATSKEINSSVLFLTAHDKRGETPDIDWRATARAAEVIVLYMGLRKAAEVAARLLAAGRGGDTPLTFVSSASLPHQRVFETTLEAVAEGQFDVSRVPGPALVVIGHAGANRRELDWFSKLAGGLPLG